MIKSTKLLFLLILYLIPDHVLSDDWVKTDNGCEYLTGHTDASKVTWDGECLDGKVHGEGTLTIYKNDTLFYEFKGVCQNGAPRKGEIHWANDSQYANYVWLKNDKDKQQTLGIFKYQNAETVLGEVAGFDNSYRIVIYQDGSYKCGIINTETNLFTSFIPIAEFEDYFRKNYTKNQYEHFIPVELPKKTIAITYFDNTSEDRSYDPLSKGLADMLISDLSGIESVSMVEREKLDAILKEIDLGESKFIDDATAQKMGKGLGAQYILTGSFIVMRDDFRIDARLVNVGKGEIVFSKAVDGNKETFFDIEKELAKEIISKLDLSVSNQWLSQMEDAGTRSLDAYADYIKGNEFFLSANYDSAKYYYELSLEHDTRFKMARDYEFMSYLNMMQKKYLDVFANNARLDDSNRSYDSLIIFFNYLKKTREDPDYFLSKDPILGTDVSLFETAEIILKDLSTTISNVYFGVRKDTTTTLDIMNYARVEFPNHSDIWLESAWFFYQTGDYKSAFNCYDYILENHSITKGYKNAILQSVSSIAFELGAWEKVIEVNTIRLELDPNNFQVYRNLATGYYNTEEKEKSIEYFKKMITLGGVKWESYIHIGLAYYFAGKHVESVDYLERTKELFDENKGQHWYDTNIIMLYDYLSWAYIFNGNMVKAKNLIENEILISFPNYANAFYTLGWVYQEMEDIEKAKENYLRSISIDSTNWKAYNQLGYGIYFKNEFYEKAEKIFLEGLNHNSLSPNLNHSLGETYLKQEKYDDAVDQFEKALEMDSTHVHSYLSLANLYEILDDSIFIDYYQKASEHGSKEAKKWIRKNKKLIDEHNNKSKKATQSDYIEELKKLAELKGLGIITEEEFEAKKKELLGL